MDAVFKALADESRRKLLDALFKKEGLTTQELEKVLEDDMTRFGVMKHLHILEKASLVTTRKVGRFRYHYLNPVPIQQLSERWLSRYTALWAQSMNDLKNKLERNDFMDKPKHVFVTVIKTTPEKLWTALTDGSMTPLYYYGGALKTSLKKGTDFNYMAPDGSVMCGGEVIESIPLKKLVTSFTGNWDPAMKADAPTRVTYEIEQQGDCCRLTLVHDDFDGATATYERVGGGWPGILSGLKTLLETGKPLEYNPMAA